MKAPNHNRLQAVVSDPIPEETGGSSANPIRRLTMPKQRPR